MAVIDDNTKEQIKKMLEDMKEEVHLIFFNKETEVAPYIKNMLTELVELSPKLDLKVVDFKKDDEKAKELTVKDAPATAVTCKTIKGKVVYYGIPSGYEFGAFLQFIVTASKGTTELSESTKEFLKGLKDKLLLEVFVTPQCPHCPVSAYLSYLLTMESDKVITHLYEASEFPEISNRYGVTGVPHTQINETMGNYIGGYPEKEAIEQIKQVLEKNSSKKEETNKDNKDDKSEENNKE